MSDFSNVAKLAGKVAKHAAVMELDQNNNETKSGERETGEDDDDLLIDSDDTNEEGPSICFRTSILMVAVVLLVAVCWMLNLEMPDMKPGCPDSLSGLAG